MLGGPRLSALQDNYVWILQEAQSGKVAIVDPSEAAPVAEALEQRCRSLPISLQSTVACEQLLRMQDLIRCPCVSLVPANDSGNRPH